MKTSSVFLERNLSKQVNTCSQEINMYVHRVSCNLLREFIIKKRIYNNETVNYLSIFYLLIWQSGINGINYDA